MDHRVLFMLPPAALRGAFTGVSLRRTRSLCVASQPPSFSRETIKALTPRKPDRRKEKKRFKQRELFQWQKQIDRDINSERRGVGFWPMNSPERYTSEKEARQPYTKRANDRILRHFPKGVNTFLDGGPLDRLLATLRARYLERMHAEDLEGKLTPLTDDIEALYALCIKEIQTCDELYYADDPKPRVPDRQYDELVMHLLEIERVYPQLISDDSPSRVVGHAAARDAVLLHDAEEAGGKSVRAAEMMWEPRRSRTFAQVRHPVPMLSLANAYSQADLTSFGRRAEHAASRVCVEMKIDGVALSLHYEERRLVCAVTRGNGRVGDDVTENIRTGLIGRGVPETLPDSVPNTLIIVRGEVFISPSDFDILQKESDHKLSNPRNAAAGAIKHKNADEVRARCPQFIAYECQTFDANDGQPNGGANDAYRNFWPTQADTLSGLGTWGFGAMPKYKVVDDMQQAEEYAFTIENARADLPFEADGVVLKIDDSEKRLTLGRTAKSPRGAIALKFTARSVLTTINAVRMQVSRNGAITPVAELDPAVIGGATIRRATMHNFDEVTRLGAAVGDVVLLERGGDVIPKITRVERKGTRRVPIVPPTNCPCCGSVLKVEHNEAGNTSVACMDLDNCGGQNLGRLIHFVARDSMDITGVGKKTASKLLDSGLVVRLGDIFDITVDELTALDGIREKSAIALFDAVQTARTSRSLERLIIALGVPGVGRTSARALALKAVSLDGLRKLTSAGDPYLLSMANVAEKSAERIAEFLASDRIQSELAVLARNVSVDGVVDNPEEFDGEQNVVVRGIQISGKRFVFTGTLHSMPRAIAVQKIKKAGGIVSSSLSNKTDYLISGVDAGFKYHKAQRIGVPVLFEEDLEELFANKTDQSVDSDDEDNGAEGTDDTDLSTEETLGDALTAKESQEIDSEFDEPSGQRQGAKKKEKLPDEIEKSLAEFLIDKIDEMGGVLDPPDLDSMKATPAAKKKKKKTGPVKRRKGFGFSFETEDTELEDNLPDNAPLFPTEEELDRELEKLMRNPKHMQHLKDLQKKYPMGKK